MVRNPTFIKNNKGIGLIGVLASISIVLFIASSVGFVMNTTMKNLQRSATKNDSNLLKLQIESVLQRGAACLYNLKNLNNVNFGVAPKYNLTSLMQESSMGVYSTPLIPALSTPLAANSNLSVSSMNLTQQGSNAAPTPILVTSTTKLFLTDLKISFQQILGMGQVKALTIAVMRIETDLAGEIIHCELIPPGDAADLCTDLGMTWDVAFRDCMGSPVQICAAVQGTLDGFGRCIAAGTIVNAVCAPGSFVRGMNMHGTTLCYTPDVNGIWSDWSTCTGGTQTRTCLVGTCTGPTARSCP